MVLVKMLMKIGPPTMRGSLVMSMALIFPTRREVSPAESLRRRAKVLLPKFHLETAVLHPESLLIIFSRANGLIYQKMGTGGWPGAPQATRVRLGGQARPGALWAPGWPSLVFLLPSIFYLFQNKSPWNFSSFGDVQNRYLWHSFFRSRIPAAGNLPPYVNLAY